MTYIPGSLEILDSQIERMAEEFDGMHCMNCGKETKDFHPMYNHPAAPAVCQECMQKEIKKENNAHT